MKEEEIQDELVSIRNLMERSSKFISLSGLSGILAGVYALVGAGAASYSFYNALPEYSFSNKKIPIIELFFYGDSQVLVPQLLLIAFLVLAASLGTGVFLTTRKAKKKGQPVWSSTSRALLFHMATPLITAGIFILILIHRGHYGLAAPVSLIFYGLALIGASNFTFNMVKYLGLCEIVLGLTAACLPGYGLLFWAIGFGVLHIVYGSMMYFKYDR